ncbi:MAG: FAD-dependent oxidoreductase [Chloroflexi bacterium]|nr:FAD-dependent oxidoreductase [Chloroflexota bacterium]
MTEEASHKSALESDVVVVGYGGAGAAAAITAHDSGASVTILEKMPTPGGNTRLSEISFFTPPAGMGPQAVEHIEKLCFGSTDRAVIEAYVDEALKNKAWIEQLGGTTEPTVFSRVRYPYDRRPAWPNVPGAEAMTNSRVTYEHSGDVPFGNRLWKLLSTNVEGRGIRVMTSTPAKELLTNKKGEVTGVVAEREGETFTIKAKRAVVLTCGGFEYNEAMKELYLPFKPFYSMASPGNTGDGIMMAQEVGAALWHMTSIKGNFGTKPPGHEGVFFVSYCSPKFIYVNKSGTRFTNETGWEAHILYLALWHWDPYQPGYPHLPVYGICDREALDSGPLAIPSGRYRDYRWSSDNSEEVAKGWIIEGKTIAELAKRISVDETALENTIARYNQYGGAGTDPDWGRSKETLAPIDMPPYYAVELWPCLGNTMGGPRRDYRARVLDTKGQPIPRLYSAGELGSLWGFLYCGGGNGGEILAVGRIAGRNAAAEQPWS